MVSSEAQIVAIGRPSFNTQVYILDQWMNIGPIGVTGEFYVGGQCLAAGYNNWHLRLNAGLQASLDSDIGPTMSWPTDAISLLLF